MKKIILLGTGGHAKVCAHVIEREKKYKIIGFVGKTSENKKKFINYPVLGADRDLEKIKKKCSNIFIAIGQIKNLFLREKLFNKLILMGFNLPSIFSSTSYVSKKAKINKGSIIMHKAIVNPEVKIGSNCIINTRSIIEHGVKVGSHTHISTGVILNGDCQIGNNSFIGSGTVLKEGVKIGNRCIIGMGQIIKKDIRDDKKIY